MSKEFNNIEFYSSADVWMCQDKYTNNWNLYQL